MKKHLFILFACLVCIASAVSIAACKDNCKEIQLMGAGDRIHDSYTFANAGVKLTDKGDNVFEISGSVDFLNDSAVKKEFNIDDSVNHVVAIKLTNCSSASTVADEVEIEVNGNKNYDAQHLNGTDYTFIILEAQAGSTTTISVKWNASAQIKEYTIYMSPNLELKAVE